MARSRKHEVGVGVLVLVALGLLAYMSMKVGALRIVGEELMVTAVLTDAAGLSEGAVVRVAGVEVGRVRSMDVDHDKAVVSMSLNKDAELREDVRIRVRARSILGEKYLELTPVSREAPLLEEGAQLSDFTGQTEIDELVNSLGPLVEAVDADAIRASIQHLAKALEDDPERLERMLRDLDRLLANAAQASDEIPGLIKETRSTLTQVRQTTADVKPILSRAQNIVTRVDSATETLPQTTREIDALVSDARAVMADGREMMQSLEVSTDKLETIVTNVSEIDKWELRRLLREEGILIRLKQSEVVPE